MAVDGQALDGDGWKSMKRTAPGVMGSGVVAGKLASAQPRVQSREAGIRPEAPGCRSMAAEACAARRGGRKRGRIEAETCSAVQSPSRRRELAAKPAPVLHSRQP